jgi:hypothetical protein
MNRTAALDPKLDTIWKFVREYISSQEFEQWIYAEPSLEEFLGELLYLDTISVDYSNKAAVIELQNTLEEFARKNSNLRCECITYQDNHVGYITTNMESFFLNRLEMKATNYEGAEWLSAYQCPSCDEWWLIAKLDGFCFLNRLSKEEKDQILDTEVWPKEFSYLPYLRGLLERAGYKGVSLKAPQHSRRPFYEFPKSLIKGSINTVVATLVVALWLPFWLVLNRLDPRSHTLRRAYSEKGLSAPPIDRKLSRDTYDSVLRGVSLETERIDTDKLRGEELRFLYWLGGKQVEKIERVRIRKGFGSTSGLRFWKQDCSCKIPDRIIRRLFARGMISSYWPHLTPRGKDNTPGK